MQDDPLMTVNVVVEGITDQSVALRLLKYTGLSVGNIYGRKGKQHILKQLYGYNTAAILGPWFVIVDLDTDADCALQAIELWLPKATHAKGMCFRIAVHEMEAWLLADAEHLAQFLHISPAKIPSEPDKEANPKQILVNLARESSKRDIQKDIVPRRGSGKDVGPGYTNQIITFVERYWHLDQAMQRSESLLRCMQALLKLVEQME